MAGNVPVPDFERGQALLARDFAALVGAVRDLLGADGGGRGRRAEGRCFRPFALAGECVPRLDAAGELVAGVQEVLFQVGGQVSLCPACAVGGVAEAQVEAQQAGVPCGMHAEVEWVKIGDNTGFSLRAVGMECEAAAWVEPVAAEDGSLRGPRHGAVVFSALEPVANVRGQVPRVPRPWVMPQRPDFVWGCASWDVDMLPLLGDIAVLPGGEDGWQVFSLKDGGFYVTETEFVEVVHAWRARLDRYGLLHFSTERV